MTAKKNEETGYSDMKLEDLFKKLEDTAQKLENGEQSLEDSFSLYHEGMSMIKACRDKIDTVEKKMQILDEEGGSHEF